MNGIQEVSGSIPLISTKGYDERLVSNRNKPLPFIKLTYWEDIGTICCHLCAFPIRVVFHFVKTALFCCLNAFHGETDFGFLQMLIKESKNPLVPMLVIDHISKPFDEKNVKAIGAELEDFFKFVDKSELQIIMFDDKDADRLGLVPDESSNLFDEGKSGFNPFYYAPVSENKSNLESAENYGEKSISENGASI